MIEMSLPTTGTKALSFAGRILPPLAGTLAFFGDPIAPPRGISKDALRFMVERLSQWHFPDLGRLWSDICNVPVYRNNIIGAGVATIGIPIAQKLLRDFGLPIPKTVDGTLNVLKRTAAGAFTGGVAAALMWLPGLQDFSPAAQAELMEAVPWLYE